ncbi:MAG: (Fe-S)-binding protein [Bacilli bacterium]|nr:(Fe-S)-binding protein [Bacilli bacterium]
MLAVVIMTIISLFISIILVNTNEYLDDKSKQEKKIMSFLPLYNCGACGFNSCEGMAEAIIVNPSNYLKCKPMTDKGKKEIEAYLKKNKLI